MLPQLDMQVNMLRQSNVTPKVSAWAHLHGQHDFNRHPLAPLGIEVRSYVPPHKRKTWSVKSQKGHYIGTSMEHYRYYMVDITETRQIQGSETVFFKHKYITMPTVTPADAIIQAAKQLADSLQGKSPSFLTPSATDQIKQLSDIFTAAAIGAPPARTTPTNKTKNRNSPMAQTPKPQQAEKACQSPRVEASPSQLIVASEIVASPTAPPSNAPNYISQDEEEEESQSKSRPKIPTLPSWIDDYVQRNCKDSPAQNTRSKAQSHTITDEILLSCVHMSSSRINPKNAASRKYPLQLLCEMAGAVLDATTGELLEYRHLIRRPQYQRVWGGAFGKEIGRLAQGLPGVVEGTDTIDFISKGEVPPDRLRDTTYARIVANYRLEKEDPNRIRITMGGDKINYPGDCGTPTADLLTVKLLFNSIISTKDAKFMTIDISNFYLNTPLKRKEYMRMKLADFPDNVIEHYKLKEKATPDGFVYVAVKKGMYGLPHAGILAQELLEERLNKHDYFQSQHTPGFWTHKWRPICFSLVVDDFGVKYVGKEHAEHLVSVIDEHYDCKCEWDGRRYLGLTLDWDYEQRKIHLSMPDYIPDALKRFKHMKPKQPQLSPHPHTIPQYGQKTQYAKEEIEEPEVSAEMKTYVQQVLGTFLYYARAVDLTMLVALGTIATEQARPTQSTLDKVEQFLDYAASNPSAILTFHASDMVLAVHSDASYLSESNARSRAGGHFFMSNNDEFPANNGAVLNIAQIIKAVMTSAAEAEIGAMYINAREAVPARKTLEEMGHPQPRTPMQTDNSAAHAVVTNNVQPKRTKAMDMRFHWLRCRAAQKQFRYYWRPGTLNLGDYVTKHHPGSHHKNMRPEFLTPQRTLDELRRRQQRARTSVEIAQSMLELCTNIPAARVC